MAERTKSTSAGAKTRKALPSPTNLDTSPRTHKSTPPISRQKQGFPDADVLRPSSSKVCTLSGPKVYTEDTVLTNSPKKGLNTTILNNNKSVPDMNRDIAYCQFMRNKLLESVAKRKIAKVEQQMEIQIVLLAERYRIVKEKINKTNRRLKEILSVINLKRLLDNENTQCEQFCQMTKESNAAALLQDVSTAVHPIVDKVILHNVDFGYDEATGYKNLLDSVDSALEDIKEMNKANGLTTEMLDAYDCILQNCLQLENDALRLRTVMSQFEKKFPEFSKQVIQEASKTMAAKTKADNENNNLLRKRASIKRSKSEDI